MVATKVTLGEDDLLRVVTRGVKRTEVTEGGCWCQMDQMLLVDLYFHHITTISGVERTARE